MRQKFASVTRFNTYQSTCLPQLYWEVIPQHRTHIAKTIF